MARPHVRDIDRGMRKLVREMRKGSVECAAGYPVGTQGTLAEGSTPIWKYMLFNEEGTASIPSRPFMRSAFDSNVDRYERMMVEGSAEIPKGSATLQAIMSRIAVEMHNDIKRSILSGSFDPNAPSTVERKGSSKPLVDTGAALSAVTFEVRTRRKK